jgi:hypothetical protein
MTMTTEADPQPDSESDPKPQPTGSRRSWVSRTRPDAVDSSLPDDSSLGRHGRGCLFLFLLALLPGSGLCAVSAGLLGLTSLLQRQVWGWWMIAGAAFFTTVFGFSVAGIRRLLRPEQETRSSDR